MIQERNPASQPGIKPKRNTTPHTDTYPAARPEIKPERIEPPYVRHTPPLVPACRQTTENRAVQPL